MGYNSVAVIIGLSLFVLTLLPPKIAKSGEKNEKFDLTVVQGHRSWCQSKAHMRLSIIVTNSNFGRICYRFRDIDA